MAIQAEKIAYQQCAQCGMSNLCFTVGLTEAEIAQIDRAVSQRQLLHKGDYLFRQGQTFNNIYAIRSGSLKTLVQSENG